MNRKKIKRHTFALDGGTYMYRFKKASIPRYEKEIPQYCRQRWHDYHHLPIHPHGEVRSTAAGGGKAPRSGVVTGGDRREPPVLSDD